MVKVDVRDILKAAGLSKTVELSALARDCGIEGGDCAFEAPLTARVELTHIKGMIRAKGRVLAPYETFCARCLKPVSAAVDKRFDEGFVELGGLRAREAGDLYTYSEKEVDLADMLRDAVLLDLPIRHLCSEGCKALCPRCGKDLNEGPCGCGQDARDAADGPFGALGGFFD